MANDTKFIDGLIVKPPHENAPDYVIAKLAIKREELIAWLQAQTGEWINGEIKQGQSGKFYAAVDEWKPNTPRQSQAPAPAPAPRQAAAPKSAGDDFVEDEIPF